MQSKTRSYQKLAQKFYEEAGTTPKQLQMSNNQSIQNIDKTFLKKRDRPLQKKKIKQDHTRKQQSAILPPIQSPSVNKQQQQMNLSTERSQPFRQDEILVYQPEPEVIELETIIRKPNYIKVQENHIVKGCLGHASVVFKRPILEGNYYFEVKILQDQSHTKQLKDKSSVRIGMCPANYLTTIPLGRQNSFGYRSNDGCLITDKKARQFGPKYEEGDIIGVSITIQPPHKYPNKEKLSEGSKVKFYKNNSQVGTFQQIKQQFYCIGISLFNFAKVSIRISVQEMESVPEGFLGYSQSLKQQIPYKVIRNSRVFNI